MRSNYSKLEQIYAGKYVVVYKQNIVAFGDSFGEADSKARMIVPKDDHYLIEFIDYGDLHAYVLAISRGTTESWDGFTKRLKIL